MSKSVVKRFDNSMFGALSTVSDSRGNIFFRAKQVADKLGYADPNSAVKSYCEKSNSISEIFGKNADSDNLFGQGTASVLEKSNFYKTIIIPESDVYLLVMRSKLKSAESFRRWLAEDVLPAIRKTGSYNTAKTPATHSTVLEYKKHYRSLFDDLGSRSCDRMHLATVNKFNNEFVGIPAGGRKHASEKEMAKLSAYNAVQKVGLVGTGDEGWDAVNNCRASGQMLNKVFEYKDVDNAERAEKRLQA